MANPPILTLSDIMLTFGGNPLFEGVNATVHEGARTCLVGRNGSGKSTLLKVIAGIVEPDSGNRFVQPGMSIGYMDQHPDLSDFATLGDFAMSGLQQGEEYKVEMAAEGLKLNPDQTPQAASGGERRRAALAKILAEAPDLMLLDEPTNHLDIEAIAWLEDHLRQTRDAFILISHDRAFLRSLTRDTMWVDRGIVRQNPKGFEGFEEWRDKTFDEEDMQRHKLNRLIKAEARWAVEGISARRKRNQGRVRRLGELKDQRASQIKRAGPAAMVFDSGQKSGKRVIEANNISKTFDDKTIVTDFSIRVARGERIAMIGPNGVGKTTLLNMLTGKLAPDTGDVKLGTNLIPAIFDQNRSALDPKVSLWDSLTEDKELGVSGQNDQIMVRGTPKHVVGYLKEFLFNENQARGPVSALSGGEKARLLLARLMAKESNLLVLDEPTNDLDVETLDLLQEILDDYDGTVLLVSHDRDFLDRVATTSIVMEGDGQATVYAGGWTDYQTQRKGTAKATSKEQAKPKKGEKSAKPKAQKPKATFKEEHRLKELPAVIERLEAEIAKLTKYLSDPELYTTAPVKFQKATEALTERQDALEAAEMEWLELEEKLGT
ncbi:ATP-binding cassette domain-containing protein [Amylibacter sp. IMCC11727]|uniref:ABC-F family ATP-binding cassette domain-containing protein n=1 Tax=Amylibacter sp. IMCC11727 TaxID=3039851 RepID=UPI00244D9AC2|nr:ATP-binding cassette domain-containing protein [Amylibacter sp. IMCC11727]WGI20468.1 ATP-binding cassette domain-containing protein [Amylibacter sp. IMCC11727]